MPSETGKMFLVLDTTGLAWGSNTQRSGLAFYADPARSLFLGCDEQSDKSIHDRCAEFWQPQGHARESSSSGRLAVRYILYEATHELTHVWLLQRTLNL